MVHFAMIRFDGASGACQRKHRNSNGCDKTTVPNNLEVGAQAWKAGALCHFEGFLGVLTILLHIPIESQVWRHSGRRNVKFYVEDRRLFPNVSCAYIWERKKRQAKNHMKTLVSRDFWGDFIYALLLPQNESPPK